MCDDNGDGQLSLEELTGHHQHLGYGDRGFGWGFYGISVMFLGLVVVFLGLKRGYKQ